jgi:hypothetical protein
LHAPEDSSYYCTVLNPNYLSLLALKAQNSFKKADILVFTVHPTHRRKLRIVGDNTQ